MKPLILTIAAESTVAVLVLAYRLRAIGGSALLGGIALVLWATSAASFLVGLPLVAFIQGVVAAFETFLWWRNRRERVQAGGR